MAVAARLPKVKAPLPSPAIKITEVTTTTLIPPERIGRGDAPRGTEEEKRFGGQLRVLSSLAGPDEIPVGPLKTLRTRLIPEELRKTSKVGQAEAEIRGPASFRKLVFQPTPPSPPVGVEGEIELKFWVLPDGTVGRIVLIRRGNLTLETAAIQNVKQWKFDSLPLGVGVPEQWGTLRFRFLSPAAKTFPPAGR